MFNCIKSILITKSITYTYNVSKIDIINKVTNFFNRKSVLFDDTHISGEFKNIESFEIKINHIALIRGGIGKTKLIGQISELQNGKTSITLTSQIAIGYFIWFFISISIGIFNSILLIESGNLNYLFSIVLTLFIIPFMCGFISKIAVSALIERYEKYIDRMLLE